MSKFDVGAAVQVTADDNNGASGTVVSWDDTRQQYLVDLGDEAQHYFGDGELEAGGS